MGVYYNFSGRLTLAALTGLCLLMVAGCSSVSMNEYDDTINPRENLTGPGIFSTADGETVLKWSTNNDDSSSVKSETRVLDGKNEFELYKNWKSLQSQDKNSAEYQDFLQWLEFQKFKAPQ